jgi:hypothetical protein
MLYSTLKRISGSSISKTVRASSKGHDRLPPSGGLDRHSSLGMRSIRGVLIRGLSDFRRPIRLKGMLFHTLFA